MTFSLIGKCPRTNMFGVAVTTASMGVGSRCAFARAGVGAVATQHRTDPRLGPRGLDLLAHGQRADQVVAELVKGDPTIGWRQFALIDSNGGTAYHHGANIDSIHAAAQGDACCAIGNMIRNERVTEAMVQAFEADPAAHLAERLICSLEAGLDAGGMPSQIKSSAVLVVHQQPFPLVDLRVELDPAPLAQLRFLWELYKAKVDFYVNRVIDPDSVPWPEA